MIITNMECFIVPPRWCFLKVETDEGIVGWGEPVIEGRASTVMQAVEELKDYLIGSDPLQIQDTWNKGKGKGDITVMCTLANKKLAWLKWTPGTLFW